ncbi:MAG: YkgJ family cysteine cluster protein, partial [Verrucomicrobiota bacterium]
MTLVKPDIITRLCTQCGLCCDGTIFDDVELGSESEATGLELLGLDVDTDDRPMLLEPCRALNGTRCTIYKHRPGCCRTFECRLLH